MQRKNSNTKKCITGQIVLLGHWPFPHRLVLTRSYLCLHLPSSLCLSTYCSLWKKYKTFVYVTYYVFMRLSWICIHICLFGPVKIQEMVPTSWTKYVCWRSFLKFRLNRLYIVRIFYIWERRTRKIQRNIQPTYKPMDNPFSYTNWYSDLLFLTLTVSGCAS